MTDVLTIGFLTAVLAGGLRLATPLALAALGEVIVERAGMINLGIEGMMAVGALAGAYGSYRAGPWAGLALGATAGLALAGVMAVIVLVARADQIVTGIAVTLLGSGLASYAYELWIPAGRLNVVSDVAPTLRVPGLADIPLVGKVVFEQSVLTYGTIGLAVIMTLALRHTTFGLAVRASGDDPDAAQVRGVDVVGTRALALAVGGLLAGLGGAAITVGYLGSYSDGVTAGRGFVAVAVVIIGSWTPAGACAGAAMFAVFEELALQAQTRDLALPVEAYTALPYAVTLAVLVVTSQRRRAPRALGRALPNV